MSEETKKVDQIEQEAKVAELPEQDLDKVAGGKSYFESRSNISVVTPGPVTPPPSKAGG